MATTTLFFELLVIGLQSSIAIALLVVAYADPSKVIALLSFAQPWANPLAVVLVGILYTVGLIVDRLCDIVLTIAKPWIYIHLRNLIDSWIVPKLVDDWMSRPTDTDSHVNEDNGEQS
jgi:hypothetical protein